MTDLTLGSARTELGLLPDAPLQMPVQRLETQRQSFRTFLMSLVATRRTSGEA